MQEEEVEVRKDEGGGEGGEKGEEGKGRGEKEKR